MGEVDYLALPLSAVDADWLDDEALPRLQRFLRGPLADGGVLWALVDSQREGNYILRRLSAWALAQGISLRNLEVASADPYLAWEEICGGPDRSGLPVTKATEAPLLVFLRRGWALPDSFLEERLPAMEGIARGWRLVFILPRLRGSMNRPPQNAERIEVPPWREVGLGTRKEVLKQLVRVGVGLDEAAINRIVLEILEGGPVSRTVTQYWIDHYLALPDPLSAIIEEPPPPSSTVNAHVLFVPPRQEELRATYRQILRHLEAADTAFQHWQGDELVRGIQQQSDPFDTTDPIHWFEGAVSRLSCLFFDATSERFWPMLQYRVVEGQLQQAKLPRFYDLLRALRTSLQHGLDPQKTHNGEVLDSCRAWYTEQVGTETPRREHFRILTEALLEEGREAVTRLAQATCKAPHSTLRRHIETMLAQYTRRRTKQQWREDLLTVADEFGAELDSERFLDKHIQRLQRQLMESVVRHNRLGPEARVLLEKVVAEELACCPVGGADLQGIGIPNGPLLGKALVHVRGLWDRRPALTRIELLEEARAWHERLLHSS